MAVRLSAGSRRVSVALPLSPSMGAYSLRLSTRPPIDSAMRMASVAASLGSSTVTVTQPVTITWRSTVAPSLSVTASPPSESAGAETPPPALPSE